MRAECILKLAEFISGASFEDLPSRVVDQASLVLLDTVGVMVRGASLPQVGRMRQQIGIDQGGDVVCPGHSGGFSCLGAGFWGGLSGSGLEYEEGNSKARGHPGIQVAPAVLAVGQAVGASGRRLLEGMIFGYEAAVRISRACSMRQGLHPTGTWGVVGSALGVGKVLGRGPEELVGIANIAASYCLTPYVRNSFAGHNVAGTFAAMTNHNAILANQLHDGGIRADERCLEMTFGRFLGDGIDWESLVHGLGERWFIIDNYFKPYPTCRFTHPAVDALADILSRIELDPTKVKRIEVITFGAAAHGGRTIPENVEALRFSLAYQLAILVIHGQLSLDTVTEASLIDPEVRHLAEKIEIRVSPDYEALLPDKFPALVKVWLKDGEQTVKEIFDPLGGPGNPLSRDYLLDKFVFLTTPVLGRKKIVSFLHDFESMSKADDIRTLLKHLAGD